MNHVHHAWLLLILALFVPWAGAQGQICPPVDVPDPLFQDTNFDGIDGDTTAAVFVSVTLGNDADPGTLSQPKATLGAAIAQAVVEGKDVYVDEGTYAVGTLTLASGVSLYGQFDASSGWTRTTSNITILQGEPLLFSHRGLWRRPILRASRSSPPAPLPVRAATACVL